MIAVMWSRSVYAKQGLLKQAVAMRSNDFNASIDPRHARMMVDIADAIVEGLRYSWRRAPSKNGGNHSNVRKLRREATRRNNIRKRLPLARR